MNEPTYSSIEASKLRTLEDIKGLSEFLCRSVEDYFDADASERGSEGFRLAVTVSKLKELLIKTT